VKVLAVGALVGALAGCGARDPPRVTRTGVLDSLVAFGEQIYRREEFDSVRVFLGPVADQARATGDSAAEARARTWLGLASWRLSDYPRARVEQERALALKLALHLERELWRSHNALGLLAWNEGRLADALRQFDSATAAATHVGDSVGIGSTAGNIGLVQTELGDFAAARQGFERMRAIGLAHSNARAVGNALNNLGMLAIRIGDAEQAIPRLREALHVYRDIDYATGEQNALGQLGTAYAALGEPQHAFATLDSALRQARRLGLRQEEASDVESLAELHRVAGDLTQALELYGEAKALNQELGQPLELGTDLRNEADIHVQLGDLDVASRSAQAALAAHRAAGARFEELSDLLVLADITDRATESAVSAGYLRAAHSLSTVLDVRAGRLGVALVEARIADRRREARRVLQVLDDAAADVRVGGYDTEWESELLRARAEARLEHWAAAAAAGRRAVAAVERVRSHYGSGMLRTTYGADRSEAYSDLVRTLRRLGHVDEAFTVSDAARGRALLDARLAGAGGDEQTARREILGEIDGLVVSIAQAEQDATSQSTAARRGTLPTLYRRLDATRRRYEAAFARASDMTGAAAVAGAPVARAVDAQAALEADEALVEYLVSSERLFGFVVTPSGITTFERPVSRQNLTNRTRLARSALARPGTAGGPTDAPVLEALYDLLIAPARLPASVRRLVVVPHGVLAYLPFAALRNSATGRYLVESVSVLSAPSAAAFVELRRRRVAVPGVQRATVFAPFPDRLPATAVEARAIRRAVGANVQTGRRATEAQFRAALAGGAIVHAATHGILNPRFPLFSRIEFWGGGTDPGNDGRLETHELLELRVMSPLVFLSGCETGLGVAGSTDFAVGEDFATLGQAFLLAGAGNVVATLWRIEDAGAAAFADRFYVHLASVGPVEALARAQRDLLSGGRYRAPFYWAAYAMSGAGGGPAQETAEVSVRQ
jgi:CHAT domain-containing protein/Tfp pilus assembly protein PilF